jgi:hypothetical protein
MSGARVAASLLVAAGLAGCSRQPGVYDLPLHQAFQGVANFSFKSLCFAGCASGQLYPKTITEMHEALTATDELPPVFGSNAPDLSMESSDPARVSWIVSKDGTELMRFVAKLEPDGAQSTRMTLDLVGSSEKTRKGMDDHPEIKRLYIVAMQEQIDSRLEHRAFDASKTYGALAAATAANIGSISRQMDAVAEADEARR